MQKLVKKEYQIPFILVTSLFFLWGFAHAILDVLNKHFQDVMNISRAHSAWVQVMFYLGYFVMAIPAGLFINKYGYRKGVVFGLLLYGIGSRFLFPVNTGCRFSSSFSPCLSLPAVWYFWKQPPILI